VVVDDLDMKITHVIRGDDHLNNTPRQINILQALGATLPVYSHVPMILGEDGKRLSKRHGAVSVMHYREAGYLPEALLNYLVRLGWAHGDQEIFEIDQMIELFDIKDINNSASTFNPAKLLWLNQHYIKTRPPEYVAHQLSWHMGKLGIDPATGPDLVDVVKAHRERAKTLVEMAQSIHYYYRDFEQFDEKTASKQLVPDVREALDKLRHALADLQPWTPAAIHQAIIDTAEAQGLKLGKIAQPLRVAVTGSGVSPPIDVTVYLVGRERVLQRIDQAVKFIREREMAA
jgi:glutamyl-tRNA synthetase